MTSLSIADAKSDKTVKKMSILLKKGKYMNKEKESVYFKLLM